ncbi:MAG: hypothetical protein CMM32_02835 [Rhodospirillaceae bacterium]|nr:hypothetical protein [Rhodospirillaceae bacterium]|tara:strand:- start:2499 stop:3296 length:798 start_codon:yes stop_codon:yes gene_type:complete
MLLARIRCGSTCQFIATGLLLIALSFFVASLIIHFKPISLDTSENSYFSQTRVWAHQGGSAKEFLPNSPEAVAAAFRSGFDGVELDIYFDRELDTIILSHDKPYVKQNGALVTLNEISPPSNGWFWLDLKNLSELKSKDIRRFAELLSQLGFAERTLVESTAMRQLIYLDIQGVQTIYWMSAGPTRTPLYYIVVKALLWVFGIDAVSISTPSHHYIQPHFMPSSIFSFTENSGERLCHLTNKRAIAVILTDLPKRQFASQCQIDQ